jgi:light-regulated signal transduction histidine kinase (bacteriophytochrome)
VGDLPSVTGDVTALGQVFSNLIGNALKYRSPERPLKIEVGGEVKEAMVSYWVRDNGLGIPEFAKARLFRSFSGFIPDRRKGKEWGWRLPIALWSVMEARYGPRAGRAQAPLLIFPYPLTQQAAPIEAQEATGDESVRI